MEVHIGIILSEFIILDAGHCTESLNRESGVNFGNTTNLFVMAFSIYTYINAKYLYMMKLINLWLFIGNFVTF